MFDFLILYYVMVLVFVGIGGPLALADDRDIIPYSGKVNHLKLIFMYQYAVYKLAKDDISIAGIILIELLTTFSVWFLNVLVLIVLCTYYVGLFICKLFYFIFRKRR